MKSRDFEDLLGSIAQAKKIRKEQEVYNYTWEEFSFDMRELVRGNRSNKKEKGWRIIHANTVVGIGKGGLPLAVILSNMKESPLKIIMANSYKNRKQKELCVEQFNPLLWKSPILLVDDIVDSGKTMKYIKSQLEVWGKKVFTVCLFYKKHSIIKPDAYFHRVKNNIWVKFPWE
jgi:hypoxanthine phosphoribosyltransferase